SNATLLACPLEGPFNFRRNDPSGMYQSTAPCKSGGVPTWSSATYTSPPVGGGPFETVTVTVADVALLPAASRTTARRVWVEPLAVVVVSHGTAYGAVVSSVPRLAPSSWNWTPATPTLSEAVAVTLTVPETVSPLAGDVRLTVGGVVSGRREGSLKTVTVTVADVVVLPSASRATAVRV